MGILGHIWVYTGTPGHPGYTVHLPLVVRGVLHAAVRAGAGGREAQIGAIHATTSQPGVIIDILGPIIGPSRTDSLNTGSRTYRRDSSSHRFCTNMLLTVLVALSQFYTFRPKEVKLANRER